MEVEGWEELEVTFGEGRGLSQIASDDGGSLVNLWVADVPISVRSLARGDVPSDGLSMVHILMRDSSESWGFLSACEMSSGEWPWWTWSLWSVFFCGFWCFW